MSVEIKVGPPVITISQGRTFMVTSYAGEIQAGSDQGVFAVDTRFISFYRLFINRLPLKVINSSELTFYAARYHLTNSEITTEGGVIKANSLSLTINRTVNEGVHEELELINFSGKKATFLLEVSIRSDFADLFEVKAQKVVQRGRTETVWHKHQRQLRTSYDNRDFHRAAVYRVTNIPHQTSVGYANGRIFFEIEVDHGESWHMCADLLLEHGQEIKEPLPGSCSFVQQATASAGALASPGRASSSDFAARQARWLNRCTRIVTSNNNLRRMYAQALLDMGALRIYDMDVSDDAWVPAAGVPWFVTLFGRDSLTVSYQNMAVSPAFARGALKRLADHQAIERNDWLDAQPGKILHEMRVGELSHFHKIPFYPYYGTADATILYLIVLSETYRWTGDVDLLRQYQQVAENCLKWIDQFGDLDGDGFQEYQTFSSLGYENVGWKDASNAVVYVDGHQVKQPKALCTLQGYTYDAKTRMAEVFQALGDEASATVLQRQAQILRQQFNNAFWMEDEDCYAFGLDGHKKQITSVASNAGQVLWSGIADRDKAERTTRRFLQEDMWSGWGIRTLSSNNPAYNPLDYQNGSVWPQDNGIIAAGFKRYGMASEANQVIRAIFDAIERFDAYRPPEVFAGLKRKGDLDFPVLYPGGANIPQAWATGSIFHMLRTILGLRADAPHKRLYVRPTLPDWLPDLELQRLRVGRCTITIRFWREQSRSCWEVHDVVKDSGVAEEDAIQVIEDSDV
ncbi:MAG: amylo-alpha-1,6-glucosidase [Verrucomicrobia bacterium]|nr:MAG: amylo-alpha-1,6-glucosidase [Verrucomicrobiota bacterium]